MTAIIKSILNQKEEIMNQELIQIIDHQYPGKLTVTSHGNGILTIFCNSHVCKYLLTMIQNEQTTEQELFESLKTIFEHGKEKLNLAPQMQRNISILQTTKMYQRLGLVAYDSTNSKVERAMPDQDVTELQKLTDNLLNSYGTLDDAIQQIMEMKLSFEYKYMELLKQYFNGFKDIRTAIFTHLQVGLKGVRDVIKHIDLDHFFQTHPWTGTYELITDAIKIDTCILLLDSMTSMYSIYFSEM